MKKILEIKNITKVFSKRVVLNDVSFTVYDGEFATILGPSGCGKSTILQIIRGFEKPDKGEILYFGENIDKIPINKRDIKMIFQNYGLFEHLNVYDNIAFGLKIKKVPKEIIAQEVKKVVEMINMEGLEKRSVLNLSGGQKQRVAIARAIINKPKILLLDEPFGALDQEIKKRLMIEIKKLQKMLGITFIYVTHDQSEAMELSDKLIIIKEGQIVQMGTNKEIYDEPKTKWIASFIGESNIYENIEYIGKKRIQIFETNLNTVDNFGLKKCNVVVVIRPEDVEIMHKDQEGHFIGKIISSDFTGIHWRYKIKYKNWEIISKDTKKYRLNQRVSIWITPSNIHLIKESDEMT